MLLILNLEVGAQVFAWFLLLCMDVGDLRVVPCPVGWQIVASWILVGNV